MAKIIQLDQNTINKIAAGEVIERPAAVVKELVENAIDAKATAVTVEIKDGGTSLIRITDNGSGINSDDIDLAFMRHSTSKISSVEDLFTVKSLGFRGEALSSIAAVAQVELITKVRSELYGIRYVIEGGEKKTTENIGCPEGTTFLVRNIFYNTPVRRKFLKTSTTEAGYVADVVERLAVSHPDIAFKFINNGQIKIHTSGNNNIKDIIYNIYGRDIAANILEVKSDTPKVSLRGYIGKPIVSRGNRNYENYYINGRYIKSAIIFKAIEEAYKPYTMLHRYPFVSLYLDIENSLIDVNVHPTKMEIRFSNSNEIYDIVYKALSDVLSGKNLIPDVELVKKKEEKEIKEPVPEPFEKNRIEENTRTQNKYANIQARNNNIIELRDDVRSEVKDTLNNARNKIDKTEIGSLKKVVDNSLSMLTEKKTGFRYANQSFSSKDRSFIDNVSDNIKTYSKEKNAEIQNAEIQNAEIQNAEIQNVQKQNIEKSYVEKTYKENVENVDSNNKDILTIKGIQGSLFDDSSILDKKEKELKIIGQVFLTYWIVEQDNNMYIIDQHAAHEKVMYERIMKKLREKTHSSQMIAPPIVITLSMREEEILKNNLNVFTRLGFEIEHFGGKDYRINAVPADMYGIANQILFLELLDSISDNDMKSAPEIVLEKTASMSCKAAVKGNNKLSYLEAKELIIELMGLDNPFNCPHGRPTIVKLSKNEMEKKFKRQL